MRIAFELEDHEENVTPMKIADALISDAKLSVTELQELCEYLTTFVNHLKELEDAAEDKTSYLIDTIKSKMPELLFKTPRKENAEPEKEEVKVERCCETCMYPGFFSSDPTCAICAATSGLDNVYPKWIPKDEIKEGNT